MASSQLDPVQDAYDAFAPFYDVYTRDYDYERWLGAVERLARVHGLRGRRVLDVACGTGESALPLARRGYRVDACDLSLGMLERARAKLAPYDARVFEADMRALPAIGPYDLITCLDDAVDYLVGPGELGAAFAGFARVLAPAGVVVFDVNTRLTYRSATQDAVEETTDHVLCRRGVGRSLADEGVLCAVTLDAFERASDGRWRRHTSRHTQRNQDRARIEAAAAAAGLRIAGAYGQQSGVRISPEIDERRDTKALYVLSRERGSDVYYKP